MAAMRRLPATPVFYASEFWLNLAWATSFTVAAVYFVRDVGLNPFQLVLAGTAMELAIFACEVPTGVVADTYSRRLSLVVGWLVMGAGMVLVGAVASVAAVLAGSAVWGFGYTFTSGAHQAWITDEVGVDAVGRVFARGQQFGYAGGLIGIGLGVAVATVDLGLAVALGGALAAAFGLVASGVLARRFARAGQERLARLLLSLTVVQVVAVVAFALTGSLVLAAATLWLYQLTRSLIAPVYLTWLNQQITDSRVRATVLSIMGQSDAIGQVAGGPGLGALGTVFPLRTALLAGGALLAPALALYARALRHGGTEPELEQLPAQDAELA